MSFLDPKVRQALNDFHKTQPALNIDGLPSGNRGILLGDLLEALWENTQALAAKLDADTGVADEDFVETTTGNDGDVDQLG